MRLIEYIFLVLIISCTAVKNKPERVDKVILYNLKGKKIYLKDSLLNNEFDKYIVIYNSVNCKNCFQQIDNSLKKIKNKSTKIYVITTSSSKYKYELAQLKKRSEIKISNSNNIFFEIAEQEGLFEYSYPKNGIFKKYNIEVTPCILRYKNGELKYFPYEAIFGNGAYSEKWLTD